MERAKFVGRVGGLAVGLGIGAAFAVTAGTASADPSAELVDAAAGTVSADPAAFDPSNFAIGFDGMNFDFGTATVNSGTAGDYDFALADGDGANAGATGGLFNSSFADGSNSSTFATGGEFNSASADGANTSASAYGGNYDFASADGMNSIAQATGGSDVAIADGTTSIVSAEDGSNDIAIGIGTSSNAFAGFANNDLAVAFGGLTANATETNGLVDITGLTPAATSAAADVLGGTAPDASWLTDFLDGSWLTSLL